MTRAEHISLIGDLAEILGDDELAVLAEIASRLVAGRAQYGSLDLATDRRDFRAEAAEEHADAIVYLAANAVRLRRRR